MHIAWLGKKTPFCGNVTYGREVTNALLDRGHQVSFLHFAQEEEGESLAESGCAEVALPFLFKSTIYTIPTPRSSRVLADALAKLKPDLVHASLTLSPLDFRLPEICEELGLPLIATFHPPFDSKLRNFSSSTQFLTYQLYAPSLAQYDKVIVFSRLQRNLLLKLGVPRQRLAIIPNGVAVERYCPGENDLKKQYQAERLFIYLGRIAPEKNVEALLKGWKFSDMGTHCKLLMVGDGILKSTLQTHYGPEMGVHWLGFVADELTRIQLLRAADAFILPSLVEGLSLSLLEAMACGTACLATDAGADGEVLENGAGIVLKTQGVTAQLKILLPLLRDHPEITELLGRKARERVLERYTFAANMVQLESLYKTVVPHQAHSANLSSYFYLLE
ncbi:glycosyltransferase family 4 protein [Synechocystis salina]|uniref:Glycosyltransferase family 4 protein n=1 Tax=Synechocystis salina LEGE 00031 TaxID=1828736 RepID=A0ABR9VUC0_9SYNC|nr:glycosyltransferase family 4 protein [Synechocystis salina]MBE9241575.1 glycosyltransferase family 4 protein [Synechocystis salina LEGE 00041]MBE9254949.1 glycosyltransferase family 4 protein [Synechocystis salina LEGE 00031]